MAAPTPIRATTQEHLDIEDIIENVVLLKDGSVAMVITTTAVNFGLLSESEQDATIYAYAALLNSLTFAVQILIRSSRKDISGYEKLLTEQETRTVSPENRDRIRKYREFILETVRQRNVLDKKFYIVIPFSVMELGVAKSATALAKGASRSLPFPKDYIIKRAKMTLEPKFDHLAHQLGRLGLRARQLTTKELIQLMFELYNHDSAHGQILASPEEYETPLVKPAVAFQENPQIVGPEEKRSTGHTEMPPPPRPAPPSFQPQTAQAPALKTAGIQPSPRMEVKPATQPIPQVPVQPQKSPAPESKTTMAHEAPIQGAQEGKPVDAQPKPTSDLDAQALIDQAVGNKQQ